MQLYPLPPHPPPFIRQMEIPRGGEQGKISFVGGMDIFWNHKLTVLGAKLQSRRMVISSVSQLSHFLCRDIIVPEQTLSPQP